MGFKQYKQAPSNARPLEKIYYAIDNFVDNLNDQYLAMRQDLGTDVPHDLFDVQTWNHWRREMKMDFSRHGIDRDRWVGLLDGLLRIRDEDGSELVLEDHDLGGIFKAAEELKAKICEIIV